MYFTEQGESLPELLAFVKQKYGGDVKILEQKSLPKRGFSGMLGSKHYEIKGFCPDSTAAPAVNNSQPSLATLQAAIEKVRSGAPVNSNTVDSQRQLRQLNKKIDILLRKQDAQGGEASYPELRIIEQLLIENDFSYFFTKKIIQQAKRFFTIEQMQQKEQFYQQIVGWIAEQIHVARWDDIHDTRIHILIGPTGVGKTTTLAKIAKLLAYGTGTKRIADIGLFTIDNYRLAAKEQLDGYGRSMHTTVKLIRTAEELTSTLAVHAQDQHILIDTIGRSPHESANLGRMREMLHHCGKDAKCSLVVSATTKQSDLTLIKKHYQPFNFQSVIITKLDETSSIGNVISAFADDTVPFVYYTNGQKVPLDIRDASKETLLSKIFGFNVHTKQALQR